MSQTPHDQFAKQFLEELLSPFGQVELSREIPGESRWVDLWFQPHPQVGRSPSAATGSAPDCIDADRSPLQPSALDRPQIDRRDLGLLGLLTQTPCLLEPYRNPPNFPAIRSCLTKRLALVADQERKHPRTPETDLPQLWILAPTFSDTALRHCGAVPNPHLPLGCYQLQPLLGSHIIILHQLPPTLDTLWLRLLGKGHCQRQAIHDVLDLPPSHNYRSLAVQLLAHWKVALDTLSPPPSEEEETLMALNQAYLEWEQKTLRQGEERGIQIGQERGIQIGQERGIQIGQERGIQIGQEQARRRVLLEMLELELEFKFGEQGRALLPYVMAVDWTEDLHCMVRSIKPLPNWEAVKNWSLEHLGAIGAEAETIDRPQQWLGLVLKLAFPGESASAIAQTQAQLVATLNPTA
ncbi:MAG: hypothetical protein VKK80_05325, partial [Prochlorothrix sp.]|nr:hypothetical protein [Prochlorothrix sp.]